MTLTEYEAALLTLPTHQRGPAAGAAQKLRQLLTTGEAFGSARDRIAGQRNYYEPLRDSGQLVNFTTLSAA